MKKLEERGMIGTRVLKYKDDYRQLYLRVLILSNT